MLFSTSLIIILVVEYSMSRKACQSLYRRHSQSGDLQADVYLANKPDNRKKGYSNSLLWNIP